MIVDLAQSIPGSPEQMAQWAQDLITKYGPEHLTAGWLKENLDYIPDGLAKQRIISKVGNVLTLKDSHDKVKADVVGSGDIFSQWRQIEAQQVEAENQKHYRDYDLL